MDIVFQASEDCNSLCTDWDADITVDGSKVAAVVSDDEVNSIFMIYRYTATSDDTDIVVNWNTDEIVNEFYTQVGAKVYKNEVN